MDDRRLFGGPDKWVLPKIGEARLSCPFGWACLSRPLKRIGLSNVMHRTCQAGPSERTRQAHPSEGRTRQVGPSESLGRACRASRDWTNRRSSHLFGATRRWDKPLVQVVSYHQIWVVNGHPRPGKPHHLANLCPPFGLVAVNGTAGTRRLVTSEGASLQTIRGVIKEGLTFTTHTPLMRVVLLAVKANHRRDGSHLSAQSGRRSWVVVFRSHGGVVCVPVDRPVNKRP